MKKTIQNNNTHLNTDNFANLHVNNFSSQKQSGKDHKLSKINIYGLSFFFFAVTMLDAVIYLQTSSFSQTEKSR